MTIRFEIKTVSPRMAKTWLAKNIEINRPIKVNKIPVYARDMKNGKWKITGEPIKFNEAGALIDGQNRLHAVVRADVPVDFAVAYDVPDEAFAVLDSGSPRSAADSLRVSPTMASIVRWSLMWDLGVFDGRSGSYKPSLTEMGERYADDMKLFDSAASRGEDCRPKGLGTARLTGMAHYVFSRISLEETHAFFDQYISGANLPERSAVLALRNRMARLRADRLSTPEQLALFIRAWNNVRTDTPTSRLMLTADGPLTNANFPMPK